MVLVESLVAYSAVPRRALESGSSGSDKSGELSSRAAVNRVRIGSLWATSAQRFLSIWRRPRTRGLGVIFSPFGFHTLQERAFNLQGQVPLLPLRARPADLIDALQSRMFRDHRVPQTTPGRTQPGRDGEPKGSMDSDESHARGCWHREGRSSDNSTDKASPKRHPATSASPPAGLRTTRTLAGRDAKTFAFLRASVCLPLQTGSTKDDVIRRPRLAGIVSRILTSSEILTAEIRRLLIGRSPL